jgi:ABC-type sulfate transport system permease component
MAFLLKQPSVLPGFGLALGFTLLYLSLIVLIPLAGLFMKTATLTWDQFWAAVTHPRCRTWKLKSKRRPPAWAPHGGKPSLA